jgi:rubrerythrin
VAHFFIKIEMGRVRETGVSRWRKVLKTVGFQGAERRLIPVGGSFNYSNIFFMKTWICEICGDAYIGEGKPTSCPFCGARHAFIKEGAVAKPVVEIKQELSAQTIKNLEETLDLEIKANATYLCMAGLADTYETVKMYKRLALVELEHANICSKLLGIKVPESVPTECSEDDAENFKKTIELEEHAAQLYAEFAKTSTETHVKIMFTALTQVEIDHIALIKNYLD